jgi:beta-xylosidase
MALSQSAGLNSMAYLVGTPRFLSSVEPDSPYLQYFDKFPPHAPQSYAQRLVWLAQRYPQVNVWQVWNEPNILGFWAPKPDPEGYARLLQTSVQALRAALPSKPIAMAGMAYFSEMAGGGLMLEALGRMGAFNHNLVVAYHPYTPDAEGSSRNAPDFVSRARHMNQSLRKANVGQVWATEWGWSSYAGPQEEQPIVGEDGQADLTLRRLALMAALDFDRVFLFTLSDLDRRASVRDRSYGLLRENGEPKPVYHALSRMLTVCGPRLTPAAEQTLGSQKPTGLVSIRWKRFDGRYVWMVWAAAPGAVNLPGVIQAEVHQPLQGTSMVVRAPDGVDAAQGVRVNITTVLQLVVYG